MLRISQCEIHHFFKVLTVTDKLDDIALTHVSKKDRKLRKALTDAAEKRIDAFLNATEVQDLAGKIRVSAEQFIHASRQWVLVCIEVNRLFEKAERIEAEILETQLLNGLRPFKKSRYPVQQLIARLNLAHSDASISKMRTIGRIHFLRKAEYEKVLPAARETLYITAQAVGADNVSTFDAAVAEEKFKKIVKSEDYSPEAPRRLVKAIIADLKLAPKTKKRANRPVTDAGMVRRVISLIAALPDARVTLPVELRKRLNTVAVRMHKDKRLSDAEFSIWSSVIA
jgi:hypothetical protein